jgi:hypothetical protein
MHAVQFMSTSHPQFSISWTNLLCFQKDFCIENYLLRLSEHSRMWITKFRTSNLHLLIETGRWYNIPREERICHLCKETIGDEYNFLLIKNHVRFTGKCMLYSLCQLPTPNSPCFSFLK